MSENILERVARAIERAVWSPNLPDHYEPTPTAKEAARAAIEALMDPSPSMRNRGATAVIDEGTPDFPGTENTCCTISARLSNEDAQRVWRAMLRAALEEKT